MPIQKGKLLYEKSVETQKIIGACGFMLFSRPVKYLKCKSRLFVHMCMAVSWTGTLDLQLFP